MKTKNPIGTALYKMLQSVNLYFRELVQGITPKFVNFFTVVLESKPKPYQDQYDDWKISALKYAIEDWDAADELFKL